jgi:AraC-like DNA-binding protein
MRTPPASHNIEWLLDPVRNVLAPATVGAAIETKQIQFPYPPHMATGVSYHTQTRDGIVLIQDEHHFIEQSCPPTIQLAAFSVTFPEPVLAIHTVHQGEVLFKDPRTNQSLLRQPGTDNFTHCNGYLIEQTIATNQPLFTTGLVIPVSQLKLLLDDEITTKLFERLQITTLNTFGEFQIPPSISKMLENCVNHSMHGTLKELQLQARILDYLCSLALHFGTDIVTTQNQNPAKTRAQAVHNFLIAAGAETPTMISLSQKFSTSPNKLNQEFAAEYGQSIYAFLTNYRLEQARLAIEKSSQPLKVIAHRVGYSHVNHFITAFKRKYKCTPGSLRA